MSDLKPLLRTRLTSFERRLLLGGMTEHPEVALELRMAQAVGVHPLIVVSMAVKARVNAFTVRAACGLVAWCSAWVAGWD